MCLSALAGVCATQTGIATTFINRDCSEVVLLDLKHLLREAKQKIPPVLLTLADPADQPAASGSGGGSNGLGGCQYCGGLGHSVLTCPKLLAVNKAKQKNSYGYDNIEDEQ